MTLPPCRRWLLEGERLEVAYEAPHGRRVNVLGAPFTHGPAAGRFEYQSWARLPTSRARKQRKTLEELAAKHGLQAEEVGPITSARLLAFVWRIAGRPAGADAGWVREREVKVVLDNFSVHTSQTGEEDKAELARAGIALVYLPSYSPELSRIEPDWNDVKQHQLPVRRFEQVAELKRAVDDALMRKAHQLQQAPAKTTNLHRADT